MSDKVFYRNHKKNTLTSDVDNARHHLERIYEGLVVDVILDHTHPRYSLTKKSGGYNVGTIKVRIFDVNQSVRDELLSWADPIDSTISEYPLFGEVVQLVKIRGNFFYTKKVPISRFLQENGMLKLNEALRNRSGNTVNALISSGNERSIKDHRFGLYYKPDSRIRNLKHFEGDTLYQGRMGHSVRYGSSRMDPTSNGLAPNLIIRTGQAFGIENDRNRRSFDSPYSLILEDINHDVSSLWMTSNQHVPFRPSTINAGSFYRSIADPPNKFGGGSVFLTSDRVVINSKNGHTLLFSSNETYINSIGRISLDTDESIFITSRLDIHRKASGYIDSISDTDHLFRSGRNTSISSLRDTSLVSRRIFIGSSADDGEPLVAGTTLSRFLARLINVLMGTGTPTPPPSTVSPGIAATAHGMFGISPVQLNPLIVSGLQQLYAELAQENDGSETGGTFSGAPFNSVDNFVNITNEDPSPMIELNEFIGGERIEVVNNDWNLSEDYYKVV